MHFLNLHTHKSSNDDSVLDIVNIYPNEFPAGVKYYSTGIHPWHIQIDKIDEELAIIESMLVEHNCLALGECGLDKRVETPMELQAEVFEKQLLIAQRHQMPIILHCVAAFGEVIEMKKRLKISIPIIVHGFSKNEQTAKQLLDNGFYLSFGKYLLRNPELESVFKMVPDDRFFLETDTIEESIGEVYALASKYRNISLEALQQLINKNFIFVFNRSGKIQQANNLSI